MSMRQVAVVVDERLSLIRFEEPLSRYANLKYGGPFGLDFCNTFTHFSDYLAVLRSVEQLLLHCAYTKTLF